METAKDLVIGNTEKRLFSRLLDLGVDPDSAKKIMSFWMFLGSKDFNDIHEKLFSCDDKFVGFACAEAKVALAFLEDDKKGPISSISCPITSTLGNPNVSLVNNLQDREEVSREISTLHNNVCSVAFEAILEERDMKAKMAAGGEGTSQESKMHGSENATEGLSLTQQPFKSNLNPFAEEWKPPVGGASAEERSLFMTFSRGYPLSREEVIDHFIRKYGDCVEDIFIHQPQDREPEFGKIVFKYSYISTLILQQKEVVKVYIGGKTLFLKRYQPS